MIKELVILGAGGFAREASLLVEEINLFEQTNQKWHLLGFIDDDTFKWNKKYRGYPVLGGGRTLARLPEEVLTICVIGEPLIKEKMVARAKEEGRQFATLVHPQVTLTEDISLGTGVIINKGCLLTTNITIGDHVSINPGCGIGHDVCIGDYSTLMWRVNLSGAVRIGRKVMLGTGATVLQEKYIGECTLVGAGAVVTRDLPSNCTAVGVPARVINI